MMNFFIKVISRIIYEFEKISRKVEKASVMTNSFVHA